MPPSDPPPELIRQALARYDEALLRQVTGRLLKPRNFWPVEELIARAVAALDNPVAVDRRLKDLPEACRKLLALVALARQPTWRVGHLIGALAALGHAEGAGPVLTLLNEGLIVPEWSGGPLRQFEQWLGAAGATAARVYFPPPVSARGRAEPLGAFGLEGRPAPGPAMSAADGLDWPLRLAVLWQQIDESPPRLTQQQGFFKRDYQRLTTDPLLNGPSVEHLADLPQPGLLAVDLARAVGLVTEADGELRAGPFPAAWADGPGRVLADLWSALPLAENWSPLAGGTAPPGEENPFPAVPLLLGAALKSIDPGRWVAADDLAAAVVRHHPYWAGENAEAAAAVRACLLAVLFQLVLVEAVRDPEGGVFVRLSAFGRGVLESDVTSLAPPSFPQTLLVQPNYEVLVYRQGLTPELLAKLTRFAAWKTIGAACTLELKADRLYRGLESGLTFAEVEHTLQRHGMRPVPPAVLEAMKSWARKRERVVVFPSATLLEFAAPADLDDAVARGLIDQRVTATIGLKYDDQSLEYRHLRLVGNRDYEARPEACVRVEGDGVTLAVDAARSDLLLESELARFAERAEDGAEGARRYRLTQRSLRSAREAGSTLQAIDEWLVVRSGSGLSPAARLLACAHEQAPAPLGRLLVLRAPTPEVADGLLQWPATRRHIADRLGPQALLVTEEGLGALRDELLALGLPVEEGPPPERNGAAP